LYCLQEYIEKSYSFCDGYNGAIIVEATGLNVHRFLPGVMGEQQISARAAYNELDLVIFFRDPISAKLMNRIYILYERMRYSKQIAKSYVNP